MRGVKQMMKKEINNQMAMNLQYFAEDDSEGKSTESTEENGGTDGASSDVDKSYTQSELDRQISKAVESAISKQREKFEAEKQAEIEKAKKEAEEYSKLSEREKLERDLTEREKAIEKKEQEIRLAKLQSDVSKDLEEQGLPSSFSDVLVLLDDSKKIKTIVTDLKDKFDSAVKEQVKESLRQDDPIEGGSIRRSGKLKSISEIARESRLIKE